MKGRRLEGMISNAAQRKAGAVEGNIAVIDERGGFKDSGLSLSGINNSPITTITSDIAANAVSIPVTDITAFPAAPNIATIGTDDDSELILYTSISGTSLAGCTRGYNGTTAKAWSSGAEIYRAFTEYDYEALKDNIEDHERRMTDPDGDVMLNSRYDPEGIGMDIYAYADSIGEAPRYGVSGVGGSATTLTRIWDSVGKTAGVSTDTPDETYQNDFDDLAPFNRRKCVGTWSDPVNGKSTFTVGAYYGDPDYTEDGTKGDYVAVEIDPLWYYQDFESGVIGVSAGRHSGWKIHPICIDKDGSVRNKTYIPCYSLVMVNGKAASLPGYFPESGHYKGLWDKCRTYNSAAILEPMAVRHYEWLMFTVEFATTDCQSVMQGASALPYSDSATYQSTVASTGAVGNNKFILATASANSYAVGQVLAMGASAYAETYKRTITAIEEYDANNKALVFDGDALDVPIGFWSNTRPYKTGACDNVLKPSGSPVSNSDSRHPMRYRWRENVWGNIYSTCGDLIDKLEGAGTEDDPYRIKWYFLKDTDYYPSSTSKPDTADLNSDAWECLDQTTEHVSGYIKVMTPDEVFPHCIVPTVQTGASTATYYCDYGYFVNGTVGIRAVRLGGAVHNGSAAGVLFFYALNAVSHASWYFGGGLYFDQ